MKSEHQLELPRRLQIEFSPDRPDPHRRRGRRDRAGPALGDLLRRVPGPHRAPGAARGRHRDQRAAGTTRSPRACGTAAPSAQVSGEGNGPVSSFVDALSGLGYHVRVLDYAEHALSVGRRRPRRGVRGVRGRPGREQRRRLGGGHGREHRHGLPQGRHLGGRPRGRLTRPDDVPEPCRLSCRRTRATTTVLPHARPPATRERSLSLSKGRGPDHYRAPVPDVPFDKLRERSTVRVRTTDYHTGGEPFRIVVDPPVAIPGTDVADRRARAIADPEVDGLRRFLCFEPRGHADMYGGFLVPPDDPGARPRASSSGTRTASPPPAATGPSPSAPGPWSPAASRRPTTA